MPVGADGCLIQVRFAILQRSRIIKTPLSMPSLNLIDRILSCPLSDENLKLSVNETITEYAFYVYASSMMRSVMLLLARLSAYVKNVFCS